MKLLCFFIMIFNITPHTFAEINNDPIQKIIVDNETKLAIWTTYKKYLANCNGDSKCIDNIGEKIRLALNLSPNYSNLFLASIGNATLPPVHLGKLPDSQLRGSLPDKSLAYDHARSCFSAGAASADFQDNILNRAIGGYERPLNSDIYENCQELYQEGSEQ